MSTAGGNFETPKQAIGGKTIRSIREASIDVAAGDTVVGLHRTEFTGAYYFHCCGDPAISPFQGLSLIHGNVTGGAHKGGAVREIDPAKKC